MELCNDNHDEICYDSTHCPACEIRNELKNNIDDLNNEINYLNNETNELENEINNLEE